MDLLISQVILVLIIVEIPAVLTCYRWRSGHIGRLQFIYLSVRAIWILWTIDMR
jgi:hypothetical protein